MENCEIKRVIKIGLSSTDKQVMKEEIGVGIGEKITPKITTDVVNKVEETLRQDFIPTSEKGAINGVATLGEDGKIPSGQLPSFVDDVIEGTIGTEVPPTTFNATDGTIYNGDNASGKIFIDIDTNIEYRWSGTQFTQIGGGGSGGTPIEVNNGEPTTDTAKSLKINNVNYGITQVEVNNLKPTIEVANTIEVNGKNYEIPSGSGGGGGLTEFTITLTHNEVASWLNDEDVIIPSDRLPKAPFPDIINIVFSSLENFVYVLEKTRYAPIDVIPEYAGTTIITTDNIDKRKNIVVKVPILKIAGNDVVFTKLHATIGTKTFIDYFKGNNDIEINLTNNEQEISFTLNQAFKDSKQNKLSAGSGIAINNATNVISSTGIGFKTIK